MAHDETGIDAAHEGADAVPEDAPSIEFEEPDSFVVEHVDRLEPSIEALSAEENAGRAEVADEEPPFDPPDAEDLLSSALEDNDPPFDPPDAEDIEGAPLLKEVVPQPTDDLLLTTVETVEEAPAVAAPEPVPPPPRAPRPDVHVLNQPVPPITVYASWDRPEMAELLTGLAGDRRLARAQFSIERGGLDGAILRLAAHESPDLLILDSTLNGPEMLSGLDRLFGLLARGSKVVVLGVVNDIALFRELAARGVSEYIVPPMRPEDVARVLCRLYADNDKSRVIAVIGARGGVGASTIAHNLAWSMAERQDVSTALLDLDLSFGTAAFSVHLNAPHSLADVFLATEPVDDAFLEQVAAKQTPRLQILSAPASLEHDFPLDGLDLVIKRARRTSSFVVLDLPHAWTAWIKQTLLSADDVLIVAGPDLASLSSAKNMLDLLSLERPKGSAPAVALSMVGVPNRPEILFKEFADALGAEPIASFAFEPDLFGLASIKGQMIGEAAPESKTALALDALATTLTGRAPVERKRATVQPPAPAEPPAEAPVISEIPDAHEVEVNQEEPASPPSPGYALGQQLELALAFPPAAAPDAEPDQPAPLDLVDVVSPLLRPDYLTRAREAAEAEFRALQSPPRKPTGLLRRLAGAAASLMFFFGGVWWLQNQTDAADAAEPRPLEDVRFEQAAISGDLTATYEHALQLIAGGEVPEGVAELRRAANGGFALAQYRLAKLYERGAGVEANLDLARQWTERAAAAGNPLAMHDLGVFLARGEGVPMDEAAAFRWFRQAAELGVADSQYNLGILYQRGRGVSANASEALFWFLLAARQGDEAAAARAAAIEANLSLMLIEQVRARALAFRPQTAGAAAGSRG